MKDYLFALILGRDRGRDLMKRRHCGFRNGLCRGQDHPPYECTHHGKTRESRKLQPAGLKRLK
jgi:hypothetical protein